ncbi:MAG: nickel pincer cofactor biosynthesis protein LarC [Candidatus Latescibacteria bacterium]|nr:nickel pincer cofactor biosynthesis protein LarC [Candidatus Latescibacterota bacterium]NIM21705.1 nickel pincer cofactor biosynthesis protein LarC [Candidatus Latescibacterota bacterium]NIM65732.1 nickel pincer cofactor biosynthesis protein LarC [Candidatus Latescibacterota bacterium]NIO02118.1 nickel pincer cofactor biosynthesis protein LarC [Candidatus Latescibacterota bacterium]NIO28935.1 nickel pincer cofactor biosynthesis protein LarC [Candidatus Latescibacterota bacterium]
MSKALLIDPFSGASGDMLLSVMIDLGAPFESLLAAISSIPVLSKAEVNRSKVKRGVIRATKLEMNLPDDTVHRSLGTILDIIDAADLEVAVKERAAGTFRRLAEAEAKVHGIDVEEVRFHETGALDAIVDIIGFHLTVEHISPEKCFYTEIALGSGKVRCEHGEIPIPAPATLELLTGHRVIFSERKEELITPTAAAIIASMFEPLPRNAHVRLDKVGYGAGTRDSGGLPNVLRAVLGEVVQAPNRVCIVTCTIDDMNPEVYGYIMEKLFALGSLEVYFNPIMMKKNRPGLEMTVIAEETDLDRVVQFILSHTTTLGLRINREERIELPRECATVQTPYGSVEIKIGRLPDGKEKISPEYESCRAAAEKADVSILEVFDAARIAWGRKGREQSSQ